MSMTDHTPTDERDQMVSFLEGTLNEGIIEQRKLREFKLEKYGQIDRYRLYRDMAGGLTKGLSSKKITLLLAAAVDRLAQLPDFNPAAEIADLDFTPEENKE